MKFEEVTVKEAKQFISYKQYKSIINGTGSDMAKFELYINMVEKYKLNPCEITLPIFYK